jgi:hypothetical protein
MKTILVLLIALMSLNASAFTVKFEPGIHTPVFGTAKWEDENENDASGDLFGRDLSYTLRFGYEIQPGMTVGIEKGMWNMAAHLEGDGSDTGPDINLQYTGFYGTYNLANKNRLGAILIQKPRTQTNGAGGAISSYSQGSKMAFGFDYTAFVKDWMGVQFRWLSVETVGETAAKDDNEQTIKIENMITVGLVFPMELNF